MLVAVRRMSIQMDATIALAVVAKTVKISRIAADTTNGTALLGPSAEDNDRPFDKQTDGPTLANIFERARRLVPSVSLDFAIKTFAAIRPASDERVRVRIDAHVPNLVHAANRSIFTLHLSATGPPWKK